jgi:phospholipid N-methyltransferase
MTAAILAAVPAGVRYLGIELDEKFHRLLVGRFPDLDFHLGSAADVGAILRERGLPRPARILSGLPFASLDARVQAAIVAGIVESLQGVGGEFRTFQYVHAYGLRAARRFRKLMGLHFGSFERVGPIVRNVPPAFVLRYWHAK